MNMSWDSLDLKDCERMSEAPSGWETSQDWHRYGFRCRKFQLTAGMSLLFAEVESWDIPHWSLVIPPTLLSAYLLLWNPCKKSQA
jgi:hypothetical protein